MLPRRLVEKPAKSETKLTHFDLKEKYSFQQKLNPNTEVQSSSSIMAVAAKSTVVVLSIVAACIHT